MINNLWYETTPRKDFRLKYLFRIFSDLFGSEDFRWSDPIRIRYAIHQSESDPNPNEYVKSDPKSDRIRIGSDFGSDCRIRRTSLVGIWGSSWLSIKTLGLDRLPCGHIFIYRWPHGALKTLGRRFRHLSWIGSLVVFFFLSFISKYCFIIFKNVL